MPSMHRASGEVVGDSNVSGTVSGTADVGVMSYGDVRIKKDAV